MSSSGRSNLPRRKLRQLSSENKRESTERKKRRRKNGRVPFTISQSFQHLNNVILLFNKQLSTRKVDPEILCLWDRVFEVICLKEQKLVNFNLGTIGRTNGLQEFLSCLGVGYSRRILCQSENGNEFWEDVFVERYWKYSRHY